MLMSGGLYRSLEEATGTQNVNKEIATLVVEEVRLKDYVWTVVNDLRWRVGME